MKMARWVLLGFSLALCISFSSTELKNLNKFIEVYDGLSYSKEALEHRHSRVKRSLDNQEKKLKLKFKALGKNFNINLWPDSSQFGSDVIIDQSGELIKPDLSIFYKGKLEDEPQSRVYGSILDGLFTGVIHAIDDVYHIENADYYPQLSSQFHSIIYKESDVNDPVQDHSRVKRSAERGRCASTDPKVKEFLHWEQNKDVVAESNEPVNLEDEIHEESLDQDHNYSKYGRAANTRTRRSPKSGPYVCSLFLQSDTMLWRHIQKTKSATDEKARLELLAIFGTHVSGIKDIYENTVFQDGKVRYTGVTFSVNRIRINTTSDCPQDEQTEQSKNLFCNPYIDVSNFLNLNSLGNHNDFCLAYVFTYRDFVGGTLGLAWVGSDGGSNGGICERYKGYDDNGRIIWKSYNTGIITFLNYGSTVPSKVSILTFAHEVGHNFGSPHDSGWECTPFSRPVNPSEKGNYIMFASATSGDKPNNRKFSVCSIRNITKVLDSVINQKSGRYNCFTATKVAFCGNGIREDDEECDCGYLEDCKDPCCHGRDGDNPNNCKLINGVQCSSMDPCCNKECKIVPLVDNLLCKSDTECSNDTFCNGKSSMCPTPPAKVNLTACNGQTQVCISGDCKDSICEKIGWDECFLSAEGATSNFDRELPCYVSCKRKGTSECISTKLVNLAEKAPELAKLINEINANDPIKLQPGAPCDNFKGYCDVYHRCRGVDADGPLARLKNLIFNQKTLNEIKVWIERYWWAVLLMSVGLVILMVIFIKICAVHTPSTNPNKKPHRPLTLRRRQQPQQSRPPPQQVQRAPPRSEPPPMAMAPTSAPPQPQPHHSRYPQPPPYEMPEHTEFTPLTEQGPPPPYTPVHPIGGPPPGKGKKRQQQKGANYKEQRV